MAVDQQAEERHAAIMAVSYGLSMADQLTLAANARKTWPRLSGAKVPDILDLCIDNDLCLAETEAFFAAHGDELPESGNFAALVAVYALILLRRPLTVAAVTELLVRAGVVDEAPGYDPVHDLAVVVASAALQPTGQDCGRDQALANLRQHVELYSWETVEQSLRALLGKAAR